MSDTTIQILLLIRFVALSVTLVCLSAITWACISDVIYAVANVKRTLKK